MERWLARYAEPLYALMRVVVGLLFACHGAQKLFGVLGGQSQLADPKLVAAGLIEFVGGGLIAVGLWAGSAAFLASGYIAVVYFTVHAPRGFWPIVNKGELAVLDCFILLYIAARGSGRLSVDALATRRRR